MRLCALALILGACGNDAQVDRATTEVERIAAMLKTPPGDEGSMGPCRGYLTKGSPDALDQSVPWTDPWGNAYTIECGNGYQVVSSGPDGMPGTEDDIRSAGRRSPLPP